MRTRTKALSVLAVAVSVAASMTVQSASGDAVAKRAEKTYHKLERRIENQPNGVVTISSHVKKKDGRITPTYIGAMFANRVDFSCDEGTFPDAGFSTQNDFKENRKDWWLHLQLPNDQRSVHRRDLEEGEARQGRRTSSSKGNDGWDFMGNDYTNCTLPGNPSYEAEFVSIERR